MMTRINLAGNWLFFPDEEKHYSAPPEQFTDEITLPGTTATNHKGNYNSNNEISHLTELYPYSGNAWFQKEICIPDKKFLYAVMQVSYTEIRRVPEIQEIYFGKMDLQNSDCHAYAEHMILHLKKMNFHQNSELASVIHRLEEMLS